MLGLVGASSYLRSTHDTNDMSPVLHRLRGRGGRVCVLAKRGVATRPVLLDNRFANLEFLVVHVNSNM